MKPLDLDHDCTPARWSLCSPAFIPYAFTEDLSDCTLSFSLRWVNRDLQRTTGLTGQSFLPVVRLEVHDWELAEIAAELAPKYGLEVAYVDLEEYA